MKFWLSKNAEISVREQLYRQIVLAIVGGDLRPGDKLPSVREMALRYQIHANTVSAVYVWLESGGWVESRRGSGVFVAEKPLREIEAATLTADSELDRLILDFIQIARTRGFTRAQIAERMNTELKPSEIKQIVLVEPDAELHRILACEIKNAVDLPLIETDPTDFTALPDSTIIAAFEEAATLIPSDLRQIRLRLNSVQNAMRGKSRPAANELIGVVSRHELFLRWSKTMLVAAGIAHDQIILRDARRPEWQRGLSACAFVIADSLIAQELPADRDVRVFRLLATESISELQNLVD